MKHLKQDSQENFTAPETDEEFSKEELEKMGADPSEFVDPKEEYPVEAVTKNVREYIRKEREITAAKKELERLEETLKKMQKLAKAPDRIFYEHVSKAEETAFYERLRGTEARITELKKIING